MLPVIFRELLAESRRPVNYWLRVCGPAALLLFYLPFALVSSGLMPGQGGNLFGHWNGILFLSIWIVAPLLTADCISREKREGTLGLLFLTPLKPRNIVVAKSFVHALRALALLLGAIPVLTIPLLVGGVSMTDIARAALLDLGALLLALAAGLRASSVSREWARTMVLASCLSLAFGLIYVQLHAIALVGGLQPLGTGWALITGARGGWSTGSGTMMTAWGGPMSGWGGWAGPRLPSPATSLTAAAGMFGLSMVALLLILLVAAWRLKRNWQEEPPSKRKQWWLQTFCTPRYWQSFFRRKMTGTLDRNPVGWLQQYSWSARLAKWGWGLALVLYECLVVSLADWDDHMALQIWPALGILISMAFSAANSFGRERQTGALELILVSPLRVTQIVNGRLLGIWSQFLPAFSIWLIVWLLLQDRRFHLIRAPYLLLFSSSFVAIAIIGLYCSMRRVHFMTAWLLTVALGLVLPLLIAMVAQFVIPGLLLQNTVYFVYMTSSSLHRTWFQQFLILVLGFMGFQWLTALLAWLLLNRNLQQRAFVLT